MADQLSLDEKRILLDLARHSIAAAVRHEPPPKLELAVMTPALQAEGASFVTLTKDGALRGCIGSLEPYQSLAADVSEHAAAAAMQDYRFPHVQDTELGDIKIEISRLTIPSLLEYTDGEDLLLKLSPGRDGVILRDGFRRATFLPQVWEKIPDKVKFLENLCYKMGVPADTWRRKHLEVLIYQVEEFHE